MDSNLIPYQPVISDIKNLITSGQNVAYNAVNRAMIMDLLERWKAHC